ncbi:MAG: DUF2200 domain-containing protein [Bacteroidetes bacterium]|jgi:hypothetical protein|nr:DUF2200 domain-containing protein [Bacteroidota bacterium]MBX7128957.1 DUF2200 domain-containing protein [Flavobacteriales bacterium]HMU15470.1 DUF2200 domain-containing protein [Flavobacteriales bacterium]HMW97108.1 DUF2200 domain-containing protein [Flavobacteriales bacterium]HMZ48456.1 DUF2200 domain-containing protein [Flavobacteriales bacterium]
MKTQDYARVFAYSFASIYPMYVQKVEKKGRTKAELDQVLCWLTGYDTKGLQKQIASKCDLKTFFAAAPRMHPNATQVTGMICGVCIEEIENPLMRDIRRMDKLVDELAKGRAMEKILRA